MVSHGARVIHLHDLDKGRILHYYASNTRMTLDQRKLEHFDIRIMGKKLTQLYVSGSLPSDDVEQ